MKGQGKFDSMRRTPEPNYLARFEGPEVAYELGNTLKTFIRSKNVLEMIRSDFSALAARDTRSV